MFIKIRLLLQKRQPYFFSCQAIISISLLVIEYVTDVLHRDIF